MQVIKTLLAHGADINAADIDGQTPLQYAVLCDNQQVGIKTSCCETKSRLKSLGRKPFSADKLAACGALQSLTCTLYFAVIACVCVNVGVYTAYTSRSFSISLTLLLCEQYSLR